MRARAKPKPPTEAELEADLRALGLTVAGLGKSVDERVLEAYVRLIRERGRLVSAREVADQLGLAPSTVACSTHRLARKGLGRQTVNPQTLRRCFVPRVGTVPIGPLRCLPIMISALPFSAESGL